MKGTENYTPSQTERADAIRAGSRRFCVMCGAYMRDSEIKNSWLRGEKEHTCETCATGRKE